MDYLYVMMYKYIFVPDQNEKFIIDKIISKLNSNSILKNNMDTSNINYKQISLSINESKDKITRDKLLVYNRNGFFSMIMFNNNQKNIDYKNEENFSNLRLEAACFSNSLKFLSQYKSNINLDEIIKWTVDGNSITDVVANDYANIYNNLFNKFYIF